MISYPVIGIAGPPKSGKNTVSQFVQACMGGYVHFLRGPAYDMLRAGLNVDFRDPYWQERMDEPIGLLEKTPRELLSSLMYDWGGPELWLNLAQAQLLRNGFGMVVPDIQQEQEAEWVRKLNGRIIHLRR